MAKRRKPKVCADCNGTGNVLNGTSAYAERVFTSLCYVLAPIPCRCLETPGSDRAGS
jgi:hypothetical protein